MTDDGLADLLTLDAVVLHDYWTAVLDAVRDAAHDVYKIVDVGSGTGTGAAGLAARFPTVDVIALDSAADMVEKLQADGIDARLADLDDGWPAIADIDITFASMSMHHLADPQRVLRELFAATRPGGIVAVAEFRDPLRMLRDDYAGGVEARAVAAVRAHHPLPELHADWPTRLADAGFELVVERTFTVDLPSPHDDRARRYARLWLSRLRQAGDDVLDAADKIGLDAALTDDAALHLHGERTLLIARRRI